MSKELKKLEKKLEKVRSSSLQDGWQTQKHAKKSRKWDVLAGEKRRLLHQIECIKNPNHDDDDGYNG